MSLSNQPIHPTPAELVKEHDGKRITLAHTQGMTLRQYYAGLALRELVASGCLISDAGVLSRQYADSAIKELESNG